MTPRHTPSQGGSFQPNADYDVTGDWRYYGTLQVGDEPVLHTGSDLNAAKLTGTVPATHAVQAGTGVATLRPSGLIHQDISLSSTPASTDATVLWSFDLPPNTLTADGDSLLVIAMGTLAANTNNKTVQLRFGVSGSRVIATTGAINVGAFVGFFRAEARIIRRTASMCDSFGSMFYGPADGSNSTVRSLVRLGTLSDDVTGFVTLDLVGTNAVAAEADITKRVVQVGYVPAAPG